MISIWWQGHINNETGVNITAHLRGMPPASKWSIPLCNLNWRPWCSCEMVYSRRLGLVCLVRGQCSIYSGQIKAGNNRYCLVKTGYRDLKVVAAFGQRYWVMPMCWTLRLAKYLPFRMAKRSNNVYDKSEGKGDAGSHPIDRGFYIRQACGCSPDKIGEGFSEGQAGHSRGVDQPLQRLLSNGCGSSSEPEVGLRHDRYIWEGKLEGPHTLLLRYQAWTIIQCSRSWNTLIQPEEYVWGWASPKHQLLHQAKQLRVNGQDNVSEMSWLTIGLSHFWQRVSPYQQYCDNVSE